MSLIARFASDPRVHDLPRVMRLPGFFHRKGEPFMVRIVRVNAVASHPAAAFPIVRNDVDGEHVSSEAAIDADQEKIRAALGVIKPDTRDIRIDVGMALRHAEINSGTDGLFTIWKDWLSQCGDYEHMKQKIGSKWSGFDRSSGPVVTLASVYFRANQAEPAWLYRYYDQVEARVNASSALGSPGDLAAMVELSIDVDQVRAADQQRASNQQHATASSNSSQESTDQASQSQATRPAVEPVTTPVDLWASFAPPPLPADLMPPTLAAFAVEQGELIGADPAGLAVASLAVCAAVIRDQIKIKVKHHGGWMESARLWAALVGPASSKKTPSITAAAWPVTDIDAKLYRTYAEEKRRWEALSADDRRSRERPKQVRARLEDTTVEAAQEILRDSPNGVLCLHDELSGWFGGMDKYAGYRGAARDRGFWLQAYNGGTYVFDRVSRGSGLIQNLSVSLLGGIQPDTMRKISADTVDDGLIQRIVPVMMRPATMSRDAEFPAAAVKYTDLVRRLYQLENPFNQIQFIDAAMEIRTELESKHLELTLYETINKKLAAHIGKYDGIFARLCLIWHCVECVEKREEPGLIDAAQAQRVADFLHGFLLPHAVAFYTSIFGLSDEHDRLTAVAGYILAHKLKVLTNRDIQRGDRTMRNLKKYDVENVFHQLDALGWVNRMAGIRPTDPPRWAVNPEVHRLFQERAAQEAERRHREREAIAAFLAARRGTSEAAGG
jgi:hypothetical protein